MWNTTQRLQATATTLLTGLALAACVKTPEPPPTSPTPPPASSVPASAPTWLAPTASVQGGAATAVEAYLGLWKAYVEAIKIPDPSYPALAEYSQGEALTVFVKGLTSVKNNDLVGAGDVVLHPEVIATRPNASPPTVDITDCVNTSATHLAKKDGSPYQDRPGGPTKATATVAKLPDGSWKVTAFAMFSDGSC